MTTYHVLWEIEVEADSAVDAAKEAKLIQQDPESIAHVYIIKTQDQPDITVDLDAPSEINQ